MEDLFVREKKKQQKKQKKNKTKQKHYNCGKYRKCLPCYKARLTFCSRSLQ